MPRSAWKVPFVDGYLLKIARDYVNSSKKPIVKIWSRRSTILPQFVGINFAVHNGKKFVSVSKRAKEVRSSNLGYLLWNK